MRRYDARLKGAFKIGVKKGVITGFGIGLKSFIVFFVYAVGFW